MTNGMKIAFIVAACLIVAGLILGGISLLAGGVLAAVLFFTHQSIMTYRAETYPSCSAVRM